MKTLSRITSLVVKEFIHLRNDWWLPAFMLIGGAMELLLVGWATSRPITNLPFIVLDLDHSASSQTLVVAIENTGTFAPAQDVGNMDEIRDLMNRGRVNAALVIPPDFETQMATADGQPTVQLILNGAETSPAMASLRAVEGVVRQMGEKLTLTHLALDLEDFAAFNPSLRVWFNEELSEAYYTTPAELALMVEFTVLLFAALSFSRERELGTLEQILVMPYSSWEIILGKAIPVIIVAFVDFILMLGVVHFIFDVPVRGSLPLLLLLAFGYLLVELGKGMVISVISRTQHQAFLMVMVIGMVDLMFTGYAAPVESMPIALQYFANLVPAHHWLSILRGILLKGAGLDVLWPSVLALAILGLVIGTFSLRYVRRSLG